MTLKTNSAEPKFQFQDCPFLSKNAPKSPVSFYTYTYFFLTLERLPLLYLHPQLTLKGCPEVAYSKTITEDLEHVLCTVNTEMKQNLECPGPWSLGRP